jgi:secreted Zn-dependent insulinase-like peptidase
VLLKQLIKSVIPYGLVTFYQKFKREALQNKQQQDIQNLLNSLCVRENSVLLLEANTTHGDGLPGMAKYLIDLGYSVDVITAGQNNLSAF